MCDIVTNALNHFGRFDFSALCGRKSPLRNAYNSSTEVDITTSDQAHLTEMNRTTPFKATYLYLTQSCKFQEEAHTPHR